MQLKMFTKISEENLLYLLAFLRLSLATSDLILPTTLPYQPLGLGQVSKIETSPPTLQRLPAVNLSRIQEIDWEDPKGR